MSANRNPFDHLQGATLSDVGRKRKNNEDSAASFPSWGVWCVADGMGGGDDGEVASRAVVRAVDACLADLPEPEEGVYTADTVVSAILKALSGASAWIFDRATRKGLNGCGSTVVGVVFDPTRPGMAVAFHAGDSRLYRLRGRDIQQITRDHSVEELMASKGGTRLNPMFQGMILRAVGVESKVDVETTRFSIRAGDVVIVCSDGLSRMLPDRRIADIVRDSEEDMGAAAKNLVEAANEAGGVDNITVSLVHVGNLPSPCPAATPSADGEAISTETTGSIAEFTELSLLEKLHRSIPWKIILIVLAVCGFVAFLAVVALTPLGRKKDVGSQPKADKNSRQVAVPSSPPAPSAAVPERRADSDGTDNSPKPPTMTPVSPPAAPAAPTPAALPDTAPASPSSDSKPETTSSLEETQADNERLRMRAQLAAKRANSASEANAVEAHEKARMDIARHLADYYYRDEFAAFARFVDRQLGKGSNASLQTMGRALYQRRADENVYEAAESFTAQARLIAARIVEIQTVPERIKDGCRALCAEEPATPAAQRALLALFDLFSLKEKTVTEGNGKLR